MVSQGIHMKEGLITKVSIAMNANLILSLNWLYTSSYLINKLMLYCKTGTLCFHVTPYY